MNGKLDTFDKNLRETRHRVDSLIKIVLIISAGSLVVSSGLYFQENALVASGQVKTFISISWWLLIGAMIFGVLTFYTIALRDYLFGERFRKNLKDYSANDITTRPRYFDEFILLFAHLGMICFVVGMLFLAFTLSSAA